MASKNPGFKGSLNNLKLTHTEKDVNLLYQIISKMPSEVLASNERSLPLILVSILMDGKATFGAKGKALDCIVYYCEVRKVSLLSHFKMFYSHACNVIYSRDRVIASKIPEESKIAVMICLTKLIENTSEQVKGVALHPDNKAFLSQGVWLACNLATHDKNIRTKIEALKFLITMTEPQGVAEKTLSLLFMHFLPGVSKQLSGIIRSDSAVVHHSVKLLAIRVWAQVIRLTLRDLPSDTKPPSDLDVMRSWLEERNNKNEEQAKISLDILFNPTISVEWKRAAGRTLWSMLTTLLPSLMTHPHPKVRECLVNFHWNIACSCADSIGEGSICSMDTLINLSYDEDEDVSSCAKEGLQSKIAREKIAKVAHKRLPWVLSRLAYALLGGETKEVAYFIVLLRGYLEQDRTDKEWFLSSPVNVRNLAAALCTALTLYVEPEILQMNSNNTDVPASRLVEIRKYKYMTPKLLVHLNEVCTLVNDALPMLVECLTEDTSMGNILALMYLIANGVELSNSMSETILRYFLAVNDKRRIEDGRTPKEQQTIAIEIALSMDGLGELWCKLPKNQMRDKFLLLALYSIVERMGSDYVYVRLAGKNAAERIALRQYDDISQLLQDNVESLVHFASLKLRQRSPDVLPATKVIVEMCPFDALLHLRNIIETVLKCSNVKPHLMAPYLGVFLMIVRCAASSRHSAASSRKNKIPNRDKWTAIVEYIREQLKKKAAEEIEEEYESEEGGDEEEVDENEGEDEINEDKKIVEEKREKKDFDPTAVSLCIAVVKRTLHCLASKDGNVVRAAVQIISEGLQVVADCDEELLPIIHQVWGPLVKKLKPSTDALTLHHCFILLTTLAGLAKDFIRFRTLKEVLPALKTAMLQMSISSRDLAKNSAFETTQKFKLQSAVLGGLGQLTCDLNLRERETDWVVETAIPYLSSRQYRILQEKTIQLFKSLLEHDPYLVEYRLKDLENTKEFTENVQRVFSVAEG